MQDAEGNAAAIPAHVLRGNRTKERVLDVAVRVATSEGLEALTIGRIASASELAKAGLLGHFRSKEELQVATLAAGRGRFAQDVVVPALARPAGTYRLAYLLRLWVRTVSSAAGGCFFASVAAEFDSRPGRVRDAIAGLLGEWLGILARLVEEGKAAGDLHEGCSAAQLAFELHGHELSLNLQRQLLDAPGAQAMAERAMKASVMRFATEAGARAFDRGWRAAAAPSRP